MLPLTGAGPSAGGESYAQKVLSYSPIAYWQMNEAAGAAICSVDSNQNGSYTNCTLGQTGIGDGETAPLFDNNDCYVNIYSTTFRDAFNKAEGTAMIWAKVYASGVWADAANRYQIILRTDSSNLIQMYKKTDLNRLAYQYNAGGTPEAYNLSGISSLVWMHLSMTWSKTAEEVKFYYNGSQSGSTFEDLGTWVGTLISTQTCIGSRNTTPADTWHGWLAHCAVWNSALAGSVIADLYSV